VPRNGLQHRQWRVSQLHRSCCVSWTVSGTSKPTTLQACNLRCSCCSLVFGPAGWFQKLASRAAAMLPQLLLFVPSRRFVCICSNNTGSKTSEVLIPLTDQSLPPTAPSALDQRSSTADITYNSTLAPATPTQTVCSMRQQVPARMRDTRYPYADQSLWK
jgi:hypothetical protein